MIIDDNQILCKSRLNHTTRLPIGKKKNSKPNKQQQTDKINDTLDDGKKTEKKTLFICLIC